MAKQDIRDKVLDIVASQLMADPESIKEESSFIEDLGADSLDTVELIMEFEDEFGIEISDERAEQVKTVGEAINLIAEALKVQE
jgi:acyl carrier protein